jgi:hypothetical protein
LPVLAMTVVAGIKNIASVISAQPNPRRRGSISVNHISTKEPPVTRFYTVAISISCMWRFGTLSQDADVFLVAVFPVSSANTDLLD